MQTEDEEHIPFERQLKTIYDRLQKRRDLVIKFLTYIDTKIEDYNNSSFLSTYIKNTQSCVEQWFVHIQNLTKKYEHEMQTMNNYLDQYWQLKQKYNHLHRHYSYAITHHDLQQIKNTKNEITTGNLVQNDVHPPSNVTTVTTTVAPIVHSTFDDKLLQQELMCSKLQLKESTLQMNSFHKQLQYSKKEIEKLMNDKQNFKSQVIYYPCTYTCFIIVL